MIPRTLRCYLGWAILTCRLVATGRRTLELLWIGCGTDDFAMPGAKRMAEFLTASGIRHTFRTSAGEHTWIVWRRYLQELAPLL